MLMGKKCFLCEDAVTNELITKDGRYFCGNDCEREYWAKCV